MLLDTSYNRLGYVKTIVLLHATEFGHEICLSGVTRCHAVCVAVLAQLQSLYAFERDPH